MFLYHVKTSSSDTSGAALDLSTISPSESMTRYVGIAGRSEAFRKDMSVVNLLLTAPGNSTLDQFCVRMRPFKRPMPRPGVNGQLTGLILVFVRLSWSIVVEHMWVWGSQPGDCGKRLAMTLV